MAAQKSIAVIVVAAGTGERIGGGPKQYRVLAGKPVLTRTIEAFTRRPDVNWVLPVIRPDHRDQFAGLGIDHPKMLAPVTGAKSRQGSVLAGLEALAAKAPDLVLIQDDYNNFSNPHVNIPLTFDSGVSTPETPWLPFLPLGGVVVAGAGYLIWRKRQSETSALAA